MEDLKGAEMDDRKEQEADDFAANLLVPAAAFEAFVEAEDFEEESIRAFAKKVGTHPAIVLGKLQHNKLVSYRTLYELKVQIELF